MVRNRSQFKPSRIFVTEDAVEDELTVRVLGRLPSVPVTILASSKDPISELPELSGEAEQIVGMTDAEKFSLGKRWLMLTRHRGAWLKGCPGTSGHVCCNLWIVNPGEGCPLDCTYCYLQSYLVRNPTLKIYTNTADMLDEIREKATKEPNRLFRVGTGEVIDSLVWDDLTDSTRELVPFFAQFPNLLLELKSKDDYVENLVAMKHEHQGKTVVSWSVNAPQVSEKDEAFTATIQQRLAAASRVVEAGYRVGFHFDPLVHFEGWEDGYKQTIEMIKSKIDPTKIAWISLSSLRYKPELQQMMMKRFEKSELPFGEQFLARDNKLRYIQPLRFRMLNFMWNELKAIRAELPIYMCMESSAAWRTVTGGPPVQGSELREVFSRRASLPIVEDSSSMSF